MLRIRARFSINARRSSWVMPNRWPSSEVVLPLSRKLSFSLRSRISPRPITLSRVSPNCLKASEWSVRKKGKSRFDKSNRSTALSLPSLTAFLVNVKNPIRSGAVPFSSSSSINPSKVLVFPVPGGPRIIWVWLGSVTTLSWRLS